MNIIKHRFLDHQINPLTETLIIGTFNPDADKNPADFFYGRGRNNLWRLIPTAYGHDSLKGKLKEEKLSFIKDQKIDFIDLIEAVEFEKDQETNYYDGYLDKRVNEWRNVIDEIKPLKFLRRVCFTRKSFSDIPKMKGQIVTIEQFCRAHGIYFQYLVTPARFYSQEKQEEWTNFLLNDNR